MTNSVIKRIFVTFCLILNFLAFSQTDSKSNTYLYNPLIINPAFAGNFDGYNVNLSHSSQLVGFDGAPSTQFVSGHFLTTNKKVGLGLSIVNDKLGPVNSFTIDGNYSYHIPLNNDINLSFGLKLGFNSFKLDYNLLNIYFPDEVGIQNSNINQWRPILGLGLILNNERQYISFSVPNLLSKEYRNKLEDITAKESWNIFMGYGYNFPINNSKLTPNILLRLTDGTALHTLINVSYDYESKALFGLNYDVKNSLGGFVGLKVFENYKLGFSYDYGTTKYSSLNKGTYSFFISYLFEKNNSVKNSVFSF